MLGVPVQLLWLASHGPTELDEGNVVLGLTHHDFERWSLFGLFLVVWGIVGLHRYQRSAYGLPGRVGFQITVGGYGLLVLAVVWDYILFDPWGHPLHGIGFLASLIGLLALIVGWIEWGAASVRAKSMPVWALPVPFLMVAGWLAAFAFGQHLYQAASIDSGVGIAVVSAAGFGALGLVLWTSPNRPAQAQEQRGTVRS